MKLNVTKALGGKGTGHTFMSTDVFMGYLWQIYRSRNAIRRIITRKYWVLYSIKHLFHKWAYRALPRKPAFGESRGQPLSWSRWHARRLFDVSNFWKCGLVSFLFEMHLSWQDRLCRSGKPNPSLKKKWSKFSVKPYGGRLALYKKLDLQILEITAEIQKNTRTVFIHLQWLECVWFLIIFNNIALKNNWIFVEKIKKICCQHLTNII